jgi:hypothetical protein
MGMIKFGSHYHVMAQKQHTGWLYSTSLEDKEMAVTSQTKTLHKFRHHIIQQHM